MRAGYSRFLNYFTGGCSPLRFVREPLDGLCVALPCAALAKGSFGLQVTRGFIQKLPSLCGRLFQGKSARSPLLGNVLPFPRRLVPFEPQKTLAAMPSASPANVPNIPRLFAESTRATSLSIWASFFSDIANKLLMAFSCASIALP
jgi:hypothetical protein